MWRLICIILCLAGPAVAQDRPAITLKMLNLVTTFNAPPWVTQRDISAESEIFQDTGKTPDGNDFQSFLMIRAQESFDDWLMMYGLTAQSNVAAPVDELVTAQVNGFRRFCDQIVAQNAPGANDQTAVFVIFCTSYGDRPDVGEVAFYKMIVMDGTWVTLGLQVRVPSFALDGSTPLPMTADQVREGLALVSDLNAVPASN